MIFLVERGPAASANCHSVGGEIAVVKNPLRIQSPWRVSRWLFVYTRGTQSYSQKVIGMFNHRIETQSIEWFQIATILTYKIQYVLPMLVGGFNPSEKY